MSYRTSGGALKRFMFGRDYSSRGTIIVPHSLIVGVPSKPIKWICKEQEKELII